MIVEFELAAHVGSSGIFPYSCYIEKKLVCVCVIMEPIKEEGIERMILHAETRVVLSFACLLTRNDYL